MHYVILTGGILEKGKAVEKALADFDKIIAVDSGASYCSKFKLFPDFIVGDFDSIDKKLLKKFEKSGSKIIQFPEEKDITDTEIGIRTAIEQGATKITILGGIQGSRIDHIISNILLLIKKRFTKVPIKFINGNQEIYAAKNKIEISGNIGDIVSFIPLVGPLNDIVSKGLKYNLANYHLSIHGNHGISNVLTAKTASVTFKNKILLIVHTLLA